MMLTQGAGRLQHMPSRTQRCTVRLQPVRAMHIDPQQLLNQLPEGAIPS